jgi:GntR family transcriptional repressor for pyruvate dehydrogenase complex
MFEKIQPQKAYTYIVNQILDLVERGDLVNGDKLPSEYVLSEKFGVSRPTMKQALSALEVLGVIETKGGKGNFVRDHLDLKSVRYRSKGLERQISPVDLLESRKLLEADIAELAAVKAEPEDLRAIEDCLNQYKRAISKKITEIDYDKVGRLDRDFHLLIAKATHNSALLQMMRFIISGLKGEVWVNLKKKSLATPGHLERYLSEHEAILKAVRNRQNNKAREIMYQHLHDVERNLFGEGES